MDRCVRGFFSAMMIEQSVLDGSLRPRVFPTACCVPAQRCTTAPRCKRQCFGSRLLSAATWSRAVHRAMMTASRCGRLRSRSDLFVVLRYRPLTAPVVWCSLCAGTAFLVLFCCYCVGFDPLFQANHLNGCVCCNCDGGVVALFLNSEQATLAKIH